MTQLTESSGRVDLIASDLAARFGGEEFVILLSNAHGAQAAAMAERIHNAVEGLVADPAGKPVTVSLEVATTSTVATGELLVQQADAALYQSKREGRNRVIVAANVGGEAMHEAMPAVEGAH